MSSWLFVSWLNKPGNFPFKKVELINPLENQESKELQKITARALNGGFFSLNVDELRAELVAELPWIKSAAVRKVWPNKLLVDIVEHKPVARWLSIEKKAAENTQLLSQKGIVFSPLLTARQKQKFAQMALLTGTGSNAEKVLKNCVLINKQLNQLELAIKQCGMNKRRSWMVKLSSEHEFNIKLGKDKIMRHLERFIKVFSGQLKPYISSVKSADLRYSNGFSVQWKPVEIVTDTLDNNPALKKSRAQE